MFDRRLLHLLFLLAASVFALGCPGTQVITETPTVEGADGQQATCKVAKDPLNPLIVEWPGTSKVDLDSASQSDVVIVSYVGCTLKVLTSCRAKSKKDDPEEAYELTSVTPARDKLQIADQSELFARLPLGAASLKGELAVGSSLELDYIAVGQRVTKKSVVGLSGECEGATHYVRTITVGAYSLDVKAKGKAGASVEVGSAGAGVGREESRRNLRGSGDVESCARTPEGKECSAVLQLGLAAIQRDGGRILDSAGFGQGIGPLGTVVVPELEEVNLGSASFRNVDSEYLTLVDRALKTEKQPRISASEKIAAWRQVRDKREKGDFRDTAEERIGEWEQVAEAEEARRKQMEKLRTQFLADREKLDQLLRIESDSLAPPAQKSAWRKEFDLAYARYDKELAELGLRSGTKGAGSGSGSGSSGGDSTATPPPEKDYAIGTPIGLEAEIGYARFGAAAPTGTTDSDGNAETAYVLGGDGLVAGANVGFPNLGAGFGLMATFRSYVGLQEPADGTALAFGGLLRWSVPASELFHFEIAGGGGYALYVTNREIKEESLVTSGSEGIAGTTAGIAGDLLINAAGPTFDFTLGGQFHVGVLLFGLRGGVNICSMTMALANEDDDAVESAEAVNAALSGLSETSVGGIVNAFIGVHF